MLLFGVGQKDTEGIYSLRAVSDDGLPTETIIAFENMEDAIRCASCFQQRQQPLVNKGAALCQRCPLRLLHSRNCAEGLHMHSAAA